ncbi:MAG: hypothetical protein PHV06_10060 [bacterium]|nr:hypothetical protein [bacterium]
MKSKKIELVLKDNIAELRNLSGNIEVYIYKLTGELSYKKTFHNIERNLRIDLLKDAELGQGKFTIIIVPETKEQVHLKFEIK